MESEMTFDECCMEVLRASRENPKNSGLQYAAAYASAGIGMTGEERRVQALYILNNLQTWRGNRAREIKAQFKLFGETK